MSSCQPHFQLIIVVMSQTSIQNKDDGYTPADFLTNLFKKPLYTPNSLGNIQTSNSFQEKLSPLRCDKENKVGSLRAIDNEGSSESKSSQKLFRSFSVMEEEKVHSRKYKIFFKTVMQGVLPEDEMDGLWTRLEESLSNPYAFDQLLDETKNKRQKTAEEVEKGQRSSEDSKRINIVERPRPHSMNKTGEGQRQRVKFTSPQSEKTSACAISQKEQKKNARQAISRDVSDIKSILCKGGRLMLQKK